MLDLVLRFGTLAGSLVISVFLVLDLLSYTRFHSDRLDRWYDGLRPWVWPAFSVHLACELVPVLGDGVGAVLEVLFIHGPIAGMACWGALYGFGGDDDDDGWDDEDDDGFDDDGGPDGRLVEPERQHELIMAGR